MSIIGEIYEEEWYQYRIERKEKMENYLKFLESMKKNNLQLGDTGNVVVNNALEEFKRVFENELR